MKLKKKNKQNNFIGGTIAVPSDDYDPLNNSCRSDITQDLNSDDLFVGSSSSSRLLRQEYAYMRKNNESNDSCSTTQLAPSQLYNMQSDSTFHTAAAVATANNNTPQLSEKGRLEIREEASLDLDRIAEDAAISCFGADADKVVMDDMGCGEKGMPRSRSRSSLVAENSSIDVSWFAARGLMSRRSFERYQEEMKGKVLDGAGRRHRKGGAFKRASISMCDLRNQEWKDDDSTSISNKKKFPRPPLVAGEGKSPKPLSVDEGLDQLIYTTKAPPREESFDESLDDLLLSIRSALKRGDVDEDKQELKNQLKKISNNVSRVSDKKEEATSGNPRSSPLDEILKSNEPLKGCSSSEDLDKLVKSHYKSLRSSIKKGDIKSCAEQTAKLDEVMRRLSLEQDESPFQSDVSTQDEILNDMTRYCSSEDLLKDDDMDFDPRALKHSITSIKSSETLKMGSGNLAGRYVPKRTASVEMKGKIAQVQNVDFNQPVEAYETPREDSHSTLGNSDDNLLINTPSSSNEDSISSTLVLDSNRMPKKNRNEKKKIPLSRGDTTISTMSPTTPHSEEREDLNSLAVPRLDRGRSDAAVSSIKLAREDSLSTKSNTPSKDTQGQPSRSDQLSRNESCRTDCAVLSAPDQEISSHTSSRNDGPRRRRSSLSSSGCSDGFPMLKRNSFSSIFTNPMDLDTLEGPPLKVSCGDVLQEGIDNLSISLLVSVYGKLRELSVLGFASVKLVDIDVNSHQSVARKKEMIRRGMKVSNDDNYLKNTKTAGAIVRTALDEYDMSKAQLSRPTNWSNQAALDYDASFLKDFNTWVEESKVKQLDKVTENIIKSLREECCTDRQVRRTSNSSPSSLERADISKALSSRRLSMAKRDSFQDAIFLQQEKMLIADHFGINRRFSREDSSKGALTESMISRKLEKSNDYFEEGSSLRNLLDSGLEVVWMADRHPDDVTWAVCINREAVTVTLVFQGQESLFGLLKDTSMSSYSNPLREEDYEGNSEFISLRSKVSDEMLRVRRDTKRSTLDEIKEKVSLIGNELTGGGKFHLSVTGDSLGGGLATVAGYFLASDSRLELASAIRVFTFSASRVGCQAFQQGFKHLEETGRLQLARFTNTGDIKTLLPIQDGYKHTGMEIRLHKADRAGRQRARSALDVTYNSNESRLGMIFHFMLNIVSASRSSKVSEYQHRLNSTREYRLALGDGVLRFDKKRNRLKSLNDYYLMKCRLTDFMSPKKVSVMPSFFVFFLVSCLISIEIALLLKFVAQW